jgi:hypothetical protein
VIDFDVGRHNLVSREDHPDSSSFFRIAADTILDPFKGIHINQEGSETCPSCLEGVGVTGLISKKYKYTHFFQFFKLVKQQQHQMNTLLHKYENTTNK